MKRWMVMTITILVALVVIGMVKDFIIKVSVESGVRIVTGLKLKMSAFRVGVINTLVDIRNLRLLNPPGFKDKYMLEMPQIYVAYDLPAIFGGKVHLKKARLNMKQFTVVKNEKGQLNLDSLRVVQAQKSGQAPTQGSGGKAPQIQIDNLRLTIGKVMYKDYSAGGAPHVTEFNVNIDEEYKDITNPYTLVSLIVVKALMNTSIAGLANFDIKGLSGSVSDKLAEAQKIAGETTQRAQAAAQQAQTAARQAAESAKQAEETVSKAADALTSAFKNPFGGK